jgi:hypothetical protein
MLLSKTFKGYAGSQLYIYDNKVYVLNPVKNNISVYSTNGELVNEVNHFTADTINSYRFIDSTLITDLVTTANGGAWNYCQYNLSGKKKRKINNPYELPSTVYIKDQAKTGVLYLGKWNNKYVFWFIDDSRMGYEKFWLVNEKGTILSTKYFLSKKFGTGFENLEEFKKLRNDSIFIFGHDGKDGIVTELPLTGMFN